MSAKTRPLLAGALPLGVAERGAISDFEIWLRERFGARIRELSLFGSRARGEALPKGATRHVAAPVEPGLLHTSTLGTSGP